MQRKSIIFLLFIISFACKEKASNNLIGIENLPKTKLLLDSTLTALQELKIERDTFYGSEDMFNRQTVDVMIQTIEPTKHSLAFISIQETDTSYFQVFIFAVDKPKWRFLSYINDLGSNQFIRETQLIDVDFDHKKDLLISSYCFASRIVSRLDCFEFDAGNCTIGRKKISGLYTSEKHDNLLGLCIDTLERTITCYTDGGSMGIEEARVYRWHQDTLQLFKQLDMVYMDTFFIYHQSYSVKNNLAITNSEDLKEGDTIGYQICLNEYRLINGKMKLIKQQKTFQEEANSYFQQWK